MTRIGEHGGGYFRLLSPRRFPLVRIFSSPESWLIVGFTGLLVVSMVVEGGRATYAAALAIGGLVAVVGLFLPERLIFLLPPLALLSGWTIQAGGLNVRLDQAMAVLLAPSLLLHLALGRIRLPLTRPMLFVLAFLAVNLLASLFSGSPQTSLVQLLNLSSAVLIAFVIIGFVSSRKSYELLFNLVLVVGFCGMVLGLLLFGLKLLGYDVAGVNLGADVQTFGIFASMAEPNIFGSYAAMMLLVGITFLLARAPQFRAKRGIFLVFTVVAASAMVLSFARGAWLAAGAGGLLLVLSKRTRRLLFVKAALRAAMMIGVSLILVYAVSPQTTNLYEYKFANLLNLEEGTGLYRAQIWIKALDNFLANPVLGNGTYSYSYLNPEDAVGVGARGQAWIPNLFILTLHDSGLLGFLMLLGFLVSTFKMLRRPLTGQGDVVLQVHAAALTALFVGMIVAYQATTAFSLGSTWVLVALMVLCGSQNQNEWNGKKSGRDDAAGVRKEEL